MSTFKHRSRHITVLAILLIVAVLIGYLATPFYLFLNPVNGIWTNINNGRYPSNQAIGIGGLSSPVTVLRDSWGVPHVYAESEEDMYYVWGYLHAQDRLFQMDTFRRMPEGRLSEVLGETTFETDLFYRNMRLDTYAQQTWDTLDEYYRSLLTAYSAGVNQYISEVKNAPPLEYKVLGFTPEPWSPVDSLALGKFMSWSLSASFIDLDYARLLNAFGNEALQQLFPLMPPDDVTIIPEGITGQDVGAASSPAPTELTTQNLQALGHQEDSISSLSEWLAQVQIPLFQQGGSNSWVVNGSKTTTGKPFLANDPHLSLVSPSLWYEVHLNLKGEGQTEPVLNERGVSFPGAPAIILGHNDFIAWGMTVFPVDALDLYYYTFNQNKTAYLYGSTIEQVVHTPTIIRVKTGNTIENRQIMLNSTRHGPLIEHDGELYAVRWTGQGPTSDLLTFYKLAHAKNLQDFKDAIQFFQAAQQNFIYADIYGNIAYFGAGRVPVRRIGYGRVPVDGGTASYEWIGYLPPEQLPQIVNPSNGFIVTANNRPITSMTPYYSSFYAQRYRAQRITELLNVTTPLSLQDMQRIQTDTLSIIARDLNPLLVNAAQTQTGNQDITTATGILQSWDYTMDSGTVAPTIFSTWLKHYLKDTWDDEYEQAGVNGPFPMTQTLDYYSRSGQQRWFDNVSTPQIETRDDTIRKALDDAIAELKQTLGSDINSWTWGRIHTYKIDHSLGSALKWLNYPTLPADGGQETVNVANGLEVSHGPSYRQIIDLSNLENSVNIIPGGQSGYRFNPQWDNQLYLWRDGVYKPMLTPREPEDVQGVESTIVFNPSGGVEP